MSEKSQFDLLHEMLCSYITNTARESVIAQPSRRTISFDLKTRKVIDLISISDSAWITPFPCREVWPYRLVLMFDGIHCTTILSNSELKIILTRDKFIECRSKLYPDGYINNNTKYVIKCQKQ